MIESIVPDAIETMNVLKGDAAFKKYGKKGLNGVIEITIKKN
jgi:outer membrane receptor for ferrienterochelin and colicin